MLHTYERFSVSRDTTNALVSEKGIIIYNTAALLYTSDRMIENRIEWWLG